MSHDFLYTKLEQWLIQGIKDQRWQVGERLPSIRQLCQEKQLSKATVQHAYQRLEAKGMVEARHKAGFFVTYQPNQIEKPSTFTTISAPKAITVPELLLDIMSRGAAFDICPSQNRQESKTGIIELNRSISRALRQQKGNSHQYYDDPAGDLSLREQLALHYNRRGARFRAEKICITSGCQHALFLALMACCQQGDVIAVESPGFYGALQLAQQLQLQVIEVPTSPETGMNIDALAEITARWKVKACIVSPSFSTPTGASMPLAAKQALIELANQYDLALIEDDIYGDLGFDATPDPLKALDTEERVILCGSFSKSVSRDLRLGWIDGARWQEKVINTKLITQLASSRFLQQGIASFIEDGGLTAHLKRQRSDLVNNRDQLIRALLNWPFKVKFSVPNGGLSLWLELPENINTLELYPDLLDEGIIITPGPLFSTSNVFQHCLRLSFAHPWEKQRLSALEKLPQLLLKNLGKV